MKSLPLSMRITVVIWAIIFIAFGVFLIANWDKYFGNYEPDNSYYVTKPGGREGIVWPPPLLPP